MRNRQHGFACGKVCLTNLIEFFELTSVVDIVNMALGKALTRSCRINWDGR